MRLLKSLCAYFRPEAPKAPTVKQAGIQARAIRHLIAHGRIDAWTITQMGTTDCHKMLSRMRRLGLLYPADDLNGHILVKNRSGAGYHRVHRWTGELPASWERPARERRFRSRGNR